MNCINKSKEKTIKESIKSELKKLNYNFNFIGTKYLIDTIYLLYYLKTYYKFSLEGDIYPVIANKYNEAVGTIKSAIIYATDQMFYDCREKDLINYIHENNVYVDNEKFKPGPKKIIQAVLIKIQDN